MEQIDLAEQKKLMRRRLLEIRRSMDEDEVKKKSGTICKKIEELSEYKNADVIFGYCPVKNEVNILPLIMSALTNGKRAALPRCTDREGHMVFCEIHSADDLVRGSFNIPEPREGLPMIKPQEGVMLVPGVGFDEKCARLGYGGGYYDRYVGASESMTYIAPSYECMVTEKLLTQEFDRAVSMVVTEIRIIRGDKYDGFN